MAASRPQSRASKKELKRQESVELSPSPRQSVAQQQQQQQQQQHHQQQKHHQQHQQQQQVEPAEKQDVVVQQSSLSVTEKIRMMLSTPREKKKLENGEHNKENVDAGVAVEEMINNMYQTAEKIITEEEQDNAETVVDDDNIVKPESPGIDRVPKISRKEKIEMIKQLPSARQEEFKAYGGNQVTGGNKPKAKKSVPKKTSSSSITSKSSRRK